MKLDCNRQHSTALGSIRSTAIGGIRLLSIAFASLCAGARADITASPWSESAPPIRFESRGWAEGVLATNLQSIAIEGGRLQSNATWDASATHLVLNWVVVPSGVTLTIAEGTIVKLCPGAGIKVEDGGTLRILGAEGAEVVVTTADDESVGGSLGELVPPQSGTVEGIQVQSSEATFSDNTHVRFTFSSAVFPTLTVQDASAKRSDGIARIPVTVSGTARETAFRVDWRAVDGSAKFDEDYLLSSGTLRWSKSSDGTKHIEIPLDAAMIRGSNTAFRVELTAHYACNVSRTTAEVVVREFDFPDMACSEWAGSASVRFDGRDGLAGAVMHGIELLGEPDGSAATPWDTTALADGWQEIAAQNGETASVLAVNSQSIAVEGGRLQSNATWGASATHLVRHSVVVPSGCTLTIGEDAVVKFLPGTCIKVEDGGMLSVVGAKGHDAIFTAANDATAGEVLPGVGPEQSGAFDGIRLQSSAATFTDNAYLQTHGFAVVDYPYVQLNDTVAFRNGGMAYVPVSIASGTRNQAFSIDWVAVDGTATFGEDYTLASGTIEWTGTSQGTKTLQIPIVTDHVVGATTSFKLRIAVNRGCNPSGSGECTVTIRELDTLPLRSSSGESAPVRFDARESLGGRIVHGVETRGEPDGSAAMPWNTAALADGWHEIAAQSGETARVLAVNSQSIAVEGGRLQSNAMWDASATHLVRHWVVVPNGKTLTVSEGAVVKICPDAGILVEDGGKLVVNGRDGADVVFTTVDDDTVGARLEAAAPQSGAVGCIRLQSSAATLQDNGWFQLRGVPCNASNIGQLSIHDAEVSRKAGMAYVAVTVSGNTRNQSFSADWEAVPGTATLGRDYTLASGRVTWSKSGDGTKWIAVPLNRKTETDERRTFTVRLKTVRGMNGAGAEATVEIREYGEGALRGGEVAFFQTKDGCAPFAIDEPVWKEPMFLHDEVPIRMSGAWQNVADPAATTARLSWESENGGGVLAEAPGGVPTTYTWRAEDWPVGSYTLRHDILDAESGRRLATYQKTFAVPTWENVELHGGTLTSNETWRAGTVHIVYETVLVPALYTILLEPGAIVKFLTGTGIVIEPGGGALFASGVVFTHINDDTVGGDTLNDGAMLAPVMDAYFFSGDLTLGDESELRCKTQTPLSGTISGSRKLTRGSTYRVSGNVTIASGATLTIPAGTILKFDEGVQMTVNSGGTLLSNGTRAAPVVFTSIKDDDFGGDTNGDGDATGPSAGDWATIKVAGGRAEFNNSKILYSSRNQTTGAINQSGGTVVFDGGEIAHGLYDAVGVESGNFFMTNAVIRDCLQAFRHWARDPIVNCVIYDCGRLTQGGGQTFVNCVFADIDDTWEAFGFPNSTYRNCVFWNKGGSVLTGEGTQDALTVCGQDGNVWGDPMFRDAEAGDYRIREGSVCIDAADSSAAPDKDMFGQKRWDFPTIANADAGAADIGVSECIPRNAASDVDLVPVSVRMSWNRPSVRPGDTPYFFWSVANEGGEDVDTDWWDELSLVSVASGRITVLGEYNQCKGVTAGGTTTGSQYFEIPPLTPGDYRLRLNANSHRNDVPEGSRTDNNVLVSETVVHVEVVTEETENGSSGMVSAGGRIVRAFDVAPDSGAMLVRVTAPEGATLHYGLGVMPGEGTASGEIVVDASGQAVFAVPEGTESVYVVLESAKDGFYDIVFLDGALAVASVSPSQVPRSGSVTLRVAGAGFADGCAVSLVAPSGAAVAPERLIRASAEELWATVDCAALAAVGNRFALRVETNAGEATLDNAVTVTGSEGRGHVWAELDLRSSARRGGMFEGKIVYGNDGNADAFCPVFKLTNPDGGVEFKLKKTDYYAKELYVVGLGSGMPRGILRPGETAQLTFLYKVDTEYLITLSIVDSDSAWIRQSVYRTWPEVQEAISEAATRLNYGPVEVCDFDTIYANAIRAGYGKNCEVVSGILRNVNTGLPMSGIRLQLCETNGLPVAECVTDANGGFLFLDLEPQEMWTLATETCQLEEGLLLNGHTDNVVYGAPFGNVSCRIVLPTGVSIIDSDLRVFVRNAGGEVFVAQNVEGGRYIASGLADDDWSWGLSVDAYLCATNSPLSTIVAGLCEDGMVEIGLTKSGIAAVSILDSDDRPLIGASVHLVNEEGVSHEAVSDSSGIARFNVSPGLYTVAAGGGWVVEDLVSVEVFEETDVETEAKLLEVPFGAFPCVGIAPLQSFFFVSPDERFLEGCSYAWDFDGDGMADSTDASPTNTYAASGTYSVGLVVRNPDGTEYSFRNPRAVEVWEPVESEYAEGTLVLDEYSGYEIVSADENGVDLRVTGTAIAAALYEGMVLVLPGNEMQPRLVASVVVLDNGNVRVTTEATSQANAYRTLRSAGIMRIRQDESNGTMCPFDEHPIPFSGTVLGCIDLESDLWYITAIDKVDGKINNYYQGLQGTLTATINVDAVLQDEEKWTVGTRLRRKFGSRKMEAVLLNKTFPVAAVPVSVRIKGFLETKAAAGFGVSVPFKVRIAIGKSYREVGRREFLMSEGGCSLLNRPFDEMSWNLNGKLEAWAGIDVTAGVGGSVDLFGKEWAVRCLEVTAKTGPNVTLEVRKQTENAHDLYSLRAGWKSEFSFAPLHASLGDFFTFTPIRAKFPKPVDESSSPYWLNWFGGEVKTPLPTMETSEHHNADGTVSVSMRSTTTSEEWQIGIPSWKMDDGTVYSEQECPTHVFPAAEPNDTVTHEIVMYDAYRLDKEWMPAIPAVKAARKKIIVYGAGMDPIPLKKVKSFKGNVPQPEDPNEVIGPYGQGDPETERFVKPGEWLDFTIYFENVTNATASAREIKIREDLSPYLDWESLTLGEIVFANETDMGLVGTSGGTSEYAVPGTNYLVRTTFTQRNGLANWYLRLVDPEGDEDGWPLDEWLYTYGGFLPPNTTNHVGEGHVSYRIKVRDDAPKNVVIETSADIIFDCNETISTDPAWWNTVGHLPVELTFNRNCNDVVLDMPTNGSYKCDAPDFGTPSREGWLFLGWADTNGVARNCGADLSYDTAALDLYAQWREEVETKFATIAVDGGVLIAGLADGQACPADLVIPATVEVGGRRVKVIGVADDAFKGKRAIQTLMVMEGVRTIGARSFMNCTSLASVSLPSTIESIGENAFYGCRLLSSVTIAAETPPALGSGAFRSVASAGVLTVPDGGEAAYGAWIGIDLGSAWTVEGYNPGEPVEPGEPEWTVLPDQNLLLYAAGTTDIRWAIEVDIDANGGLTLVQAKGSTEPGEAFVLPDPVLDADGNEYRIVAIGANADILDAGIFEGQEFVSVTIPESVETIAPCAFANCAGLREVVFAGDSPALRELGEGAFFSCTSLSAIDLAPLSSLERIGPLDAILGVFESCWYLPEVTLPATVETIGAYAFQDCSRLRAVRAGGGDAALTAIGERAFYNCDSLESVETGCLAALETMGDAAFGGDTAASAPKIARIALGTAIASLGADVFLNAAQLAEVTCLATNPPARDANAFRGMLRTGILRLPEQAIEDYTNETARAWVGAGAGKLTPWNGSTGWQVKSGDAGSMLREMESHLTDEEFEAFLALATLLGFTEEELCEVDHPAEQLEPELRIVSFDPDAVEYPLAIRFENGIDVTPAAAFARLWSASGDKIFAAVSDELGGVERRVPLLGIQGDDGFFRVNLGTAFHRDEPAQFVRIIIQ